MGGKQKIDRKEMRKELELILEAKKNINNIFLTVMTIFYALNGVLISIAVSNQSSQGVEMIAYFGIISMVLFIFITGRMRSTNTKCDRRAKVIEDKLGFEVIKNYSNKNCPHWPRFLYTIPLHVSVMFFNFIIILIWLAFLIKSY